MQAARGAEGKIYFTLKNLIFHVYDYPPPTATLCMIPISIHVRIIWTYSETQVGITMLPGVTIAW